MSKIKSIWNAVVTKVEDANVAEKACVVKTHVVLAANKAVDYAIPITNKVKDYVTSIEVSVALKKKDQDEADVEVAYVPMGRPIAHIPAGEAPVSGMPIAEYKPAQLSVAGMMHAHARKGTACTPMCVCKY